MTRPLVEVIRKIQGRNNKASNLEDWQEGLLVEDVGGVGYDICALELGRSLSFGKA